MAYRRADLDTELEYEDEAFFGGLAKIAGSLLGEGELEDEAEFEFEFEAEAESEEEYEDEDEQESFANPVRRVYRDAELMAHLSTRAAQTESEAEAEAFIGALVPLAAKLIPRAASLLSRNAPSLIRGATRITRQLRRDPRTRRLVQAMPVILQRTAQSLADQAANGQDIDAAGALDTLSTVTGRVLAGPRRGRAVGAVQVFNRRYHRRNRRGARRPGYGGLGSGAPGYGTAGYGSVPADAPSFGPAGVPGYGAARRTRRGAPARRRTRRARR